MKQKHILFVLFFISLTQIVHSTPERLRIITDHLLGFQDSRCVILQTIYDNLGSYYESVSEQYYVEKSISMNEVRIFNYEKVTKENTLSDILRKHLKPSFVPAVPLTSDDTYITFEIKDERYLMADSRRLDLTYYIQKSLQPCRVIRVIDRFYH